MLGNFIYSGESMKIGQVIRSARRHRGLTQSELASTLGVSANYISLLENDHRDPSWKFVGDLANAVQIPLPLLLLRALWDSDLGRDAAAGSELTSALIALADAAAEEANED